MLKFLKRFPAFPRSDINVRLLLTNYPCPDGTSKSKVKLQEDVARQVNLPLNHIVIVNVNSQNGFARAVRKKQRRSNVAVIIVNSSFLNVQNQKVENLVHIVSSIAMEL